MVINSQQYSALNFSVAIIFVIWLGHSLAGFSALNGFAYDFLLRNHLKAPVSEQLFVLDGEKQYAEQGDEVWLPLLKNLLQQDVKLVVFNFLPEKASADFYQLAADSGKVVFGRHIAATDSYSSPKLEGLPLGATGKNINIGAVAAVPNQGGIYRTQHRIIDVDGQHLDSLEYRVAQTLSSEPTENPNDFLINFIGGTGLIPKAKLDQAIAGNLVKDVMKGRTVLVGVYGVDSLTSFFTPISTGSQQTPALLYHAFGLDTLLAKKTISILTDVWMLLLIAVVTVTSLIFCRQLNFQHSLSLSIGFSLAYMFACWLILQSLLLWIPPIALLIAQWLMFGVAWRQRIVEEHKLLDSMLFNLSVNLQEKAFPVSFFYSQDPWGELITLITQSLQVNRMIFLERVPEDHRLKEIKAYNCNINDVSERRRDFERTPYSSAIEEQKPIFLDQPYLNALDIEEQQYLAPLIFAGDILGFWAFTLIPSEVREGQKFHDLTQAFMKQISEILFYRQQWESQEKQNKKNILTYLTFNPGTPSYQMLSKSLALLDKRIGELQQVFNSLNTGGVLYDLFGRVLLLNNTMEELAKSENLRLYNLTAMDFIAAVTGYDMIEARAIMQKAIFDRETLSLPVNDFKVGRDFILHIQPLQLADAHQLVNPTEQVFEIIGILCELEDVTELKAIYRLKEQMFE